MFQGKPPQILFNKLFIYKIAVIFLVIGIFILGFQYWRLSQHLKSMTNSSDVPPDIKGIPYYKEIMDIINPLEYSIIPSLELQPDIKLNIDFKNRKWTLRNFHQYYPNGDIVIEYGRYGLCGELAEHTYERLKPLLSDRYVIKFANVEESGFFLTPGSAHAILIVYDKATSRAFLLDPTFHRYGPLEDYHDYLFSSFSETLAGIDKKEIDVSFNVNHGEPIIIRNNFISILTIEDCDGKFDKDNFILSVQANRRYEYTGRYILALRRKDGRVSTLEDKWFENEALPPKDVDLIKKILTAWFNDINS